jgi:hypothetical protein
MMRKARVVSSSPASSKGLRWVYMLIRAVDLVLEDSAAVTTANQG